jgi:16S rRNA (guanine(966)-N(2))-methyltransferase RsmD
MRIISGLYKGRNLKGYDILGTRATMDRVKESVFASIQNYLPNSTCLDLFAGSGSLGLEALSNGAKKVVFVDNNRQATDIIKENIDMLNAKETEVITMDFKKALDQFESYNEKFDIVFLDPPYNQNLIGEASRLIIEKKILNNNALIICEYEDEKFTINLSLIGYKNYGSKNVKIYKYVES